MAGHGRRFEGKEVGVRIPGDLLAQVDDQPEGRPAFIRAAVAAEVWRRTSPLVEGRARTTDDGPDEVVGLRLPAHVARNLALLAASGSPEIGGVPVSAEQAAVIAVVGLLRQAGYYGPEDALELLDVVDPDGD